MPKPAQFRNSHNMTITNTWVMSSTLSGAHTVRLLQYWFEMISTAIGLLCLKKCDKNVGQMSACKENNNTCFVDTALWSVLDSFINLLLTAFLTYIYLHTSALQIKTLTSRDASFTGMQRT